MLVYNYLTEGNVVYEGEVRIPLLILAKFSPARPSQDVYPDPGARFSKAPKTFRVRKDIFRSSVSINGEVYTPETSCEPPFIFRIS